MGEKWAVEQKIAELKERIAARTAFAKEYQEHAGALMCEVAEMKKELSDMRDRLDQLNVKENEWPKFGDKYWSIDTFGNVNQFTCSYEGIYDNRCKSFGNVFRTKEDAEFAFERLKVLAEMRKFTFDPDWKDRNQPKWTIYYTHDNDAIKYAARHRCNLGIGIYFESEERAAACVTAIGKDRLKKYFFCVTE